MPEPLREEDLRNYYNSVIKNYPAYTEMNFTFEQWIGYLISAVLVMVENGQYKITELGQEFLRFIVITKKLTSKPT